MSIGVVIEAVWVKWCCWTPRGLPSGTSLGEDRRAEVVEGENRRAEVVETGHDHDLNKSDVKGQVWRAQGCTAPSC